MRKGRGGHKRDRPPLISTRFSTQVRGKLEVHIKLVATGWTTIGKVVRLSDFVKSLTFPESLQFRRVPQRMIYGSWCSGFNYRPDAFPVAKPTLVENIEGIKQRRMLY